MTEDEIIILPTDPNPCHLHTRIYQAALMRYCSDSMTVAQGAIPERADGGEALIDLATDQAILRHLCDQTDLHQGWVGKLIEQVVAQHGTRKRRRIVAAA